MKEFIKKIIIFLLTEEAKLVLKKQKPFIVGVTGNLGKTSTKDAIYAVLKEHYNVRRSEKSLNSEFGVPLTILGEKSGWNNPLSWVAILYRGLFAAFEERYPTHLVLEIGADKPGDIESVARWLKPNITVLTQFAEVPVHVEFFKNREHLVQEKAYLAHALAQGGTFIYNADDIDSVRIREAIERRAVSVGITSTAEVRAEKIVIYGDKVVEGTSADIAVDGKVYQLTLPQVLGKSPVYAALPAIAVARELNVPIEHAVAALRDEEKPKGRMRVLAGLNNSTLIDDTYNASPKATEHGLRTLASLEARGRKIAVLGDMMELGEYTESEHLRIGAVAAQCVHKLVCVGVRSRFTVEGALNNGMRDEDIMHFDSAQQAGSYLAGVISDGDVVYMKGSQSVRMEKAVKILLLADLSPQDVLVRQEREWLLR